MTAGPVVAALVGSQALGDVVMEHLVAASVARALPGGRLVVAYRDDRPYKAFCADLNPWLSKALVLPDTPSAVLPIDALSGRDEAAATWFTATERAAGLHRPDVLLTPSMMAMGRCLLPPPRLRIPKVRTEELADRLAAHGVDRERWFVCLHVREAGYRWRRDMDTARTNDPRDYLPMIRRIVAGGGQVVRLGDPAMTPLPAMDGLVDLAAAGAPFEDQAFAVSRSRFYVGTDSGPTQLACGFKVPTATTNAIIATVWNDGDIVLLKKYRLPDGRIMERAELAEMGAGLRHTLRPQGTELIDNTPGELLAVAEHLIEATADCPGWRPEAEDPAVDPEGSVGLPLAFRTFDAMAALDVWTA